MNFNDKAHIYENISISQKQAADQLFSMLAIKPEFKILDIGCGTGYLTEKLFNLAPNT